MFLDNHSGSRNISEAPQHPYCQSQQPESHIHSPCLTLTLLSLCITLYWQTYSGDLSSPTNYFCHYIFSGCFLSVGQNHDCCFGFYGHQSSIKDEKMGRKKTSHFHCSLLFPYSSRYLCYMADNFSPISFC